MAADAQPATAAAWNRERLGPLLSHVWTLLRPRRRLLLLGFLLMVVNRVAGLVLPYSTKFLIDVVIRERHLELLATLVLVVLLATAVQGVTAFALTQLLSKSAQRLIAGLRCQVQEHVGRLSVTFYDSHKTGALVSRIMNDVEGVRNLLGTGLVDLTGGLLTSALSLLVLFWISPVMTLLAFAFLLAFGLGVQKMLGTIRPILRERSQITAEVTGRLTETLGGIRVVKGYHAEEREHRVFAAGVQRLLDNVLQTLTVTSFLSLSSSLLLGLVGATIMYVGARQVLAGSLTVGGFFTYVLFLGFLVAPVVQVVNIGTQLTEALAGLERTRELLAQPPEDQDPNRTVPLANITGDIDFTDISFSYDTGPPVLSDISLHAEHGSVTALIGSSGAGKSTLIGLLAAFYTPKEGRIRVDGTDLNTVRLDTYRKQLGLVLQDTFLFDGTIWENVAFSRPQADRAQVLEACRMAHVDEFAEKFPAKYETVVGERGVRLSAGQRQRISIARAVLAQPRILILDEATSSLDSESEAFIQQGLAYLMEGRTTFVIAHRLSTIRRADQILVVEQGRIVERGTHPQLYARRGRYFDLYSKQHGLESNLFLAPGEGDAPSAPGEEDPAAPVEGEAPHLSDAVRLVRGEVP